MTTSILLEGGWRAYWNPLGPVALVVLNPQAQQVLAAFEAPVSTDAAAARLPGIPAKEVDGAVASLAAAGLVHPVREVSPPRTHPSTLSAWLHMTDACNLNCPYCYVKKRPTAMSLEVGRRAVERLVATAVGHGYSSLRLKYAGGEPSLNFSVVRAVHNHAMRRTDEAGLAFEGVLLSNGVDMTEAMLDYLAESGMQLMVTLDGDPSAHDRVRGRRDGGSSHALVTGTIEGALARGLYPYVSITMTALNLEGTGQAVAFALDRRLRFNLNFYREYRPTRDRFSGLVPDLGRLIGAVQQAFDLIRAYPSYPMPLTGILDRTRLDVPHEHPCSAGRDYLVVGVNGKVSACQMLLEEPWTSLSADDLLTAVRKRGGRLFGAPVQGSECDACPWRVACGGGCPLLRRTALHDQYCRAYQVLLPELVRLEADRLIASYATGL
jgi:uncharacterized protein